MSISIVTSLLLSSLIILSLFLLSLLLLLLLLLLLFIIIIIIIIILYIIVIIMIIGGIIRSFSITEDLTAVSKRGLAEALQRIILQLFIIYNYLIIHKY